MRNNREEARQYFKGCGLSYNDITIDDLNYLKWILNEKFAKLMVERKGSLWGPSYWYRVNDAKYYKGTYKDGKLVTAYLTGKGTYFQAREVISFNHNGYIGFCGEADGSNTAPVIEAFIEWCDHLKNRGDDNE